MSGESLSTMMLMRASHKS